MTIQHHLSDTTLGAFSAGSLSEALSIVTASHIDLCPICSERLKKLEELSGTYLQTSKPETMSQDALPNIMAKLDKLELERDPDLNSHDISVRSSADGSLFHEGGSIIPQPLKHYLPSNLKDIKWKSLAPGIKYYAISDLQTNGGTLSLLNIAPGINIPEHGHRGIELTQVLKVHLAIMLDVLVLAILLI
jgi:putative transcriptional regulator